MMNKLTYLVALLALCVSGSKAYEYHYNSPTLQEQREEAAILARTTLIEPDQEDPSTSENDDVSYLGRFLRGGRRLWGWQNGGGSSSCTKFWSSCSNRPSYTTGNTNTGDNHPSRPDTMRQGDIIQELAVAGSDYSILRALIRIAGLEDALKTGNYTLFAPKNSAFVGVDANALQNDILALQQVLTYHVVEGVIMSADMEDSQQLTTLQGGNITLAVNLDVPSVFINTDQAKVVMVDNQASNGVIHTIDNVLTPPPPAN
jgi:uncharacterized surface protein with fasciclin (FAS1) repeats